RSAATDSVFIPHVSVFHVLPDVSLRPGYVVCAQHPVHATHDPVYARQRHDGTERILCYDSGSLRHDGSALWLSAGGGECPLSPTRPRGYSVCGQGDPGDGD